MTVQQDERAAERQQAGRYWLGWRVQVRGQTTTDPDTAAQFGMTDWQCQCLVTPDAGTAVAPPMRRTRKATRLICQVCGEIQPGLVADDPAL